MSGLADVTPEEAFEQYRSNIEDFDVAMPMILCESDDSSLDVYQLVGTEVRDVLRVMADRGRRYKAVLLSTEARMWTYKPDGTSDTEGPVDCVVLTYADRTGREWMATRQFARIHVGNVKYLGDLRLEPPGTGNVPEGLHRLVASDI